jgi:hypothetical protein
MWNYAAMHIMFGGFIDIDIDIHTYLAVELLCNCPWFVPHTVFALFRMV